MQYFDVDKEMQWYIDAPLRRRPSRAQKVRVGHRACACPVVATNDTGSIEFVSMNEAEMLGYYPRGIRRCLQDSTKQYRGYYWTVKK